VPFQVKPLYLIIFDNPKIYNFSEFLNFNTSIPLSLINKKQSVRMYEQATLIDLDSS
jgi:aromatic ring-opening dioxygenase LigB subunit